MIKLKVKRKMTRNVNCACEECQSIVKDIAFLKMEIERLRKIELSKIDGRSHRRIKTQLERFESIRIKLDELYYGHQLGGKLNARS